MTRPSPGRTALYRIFGAGDLLLYIGISQNPRSRWYDHRSGKPWGPQAERQAVEWHATRIAAKAAEATAIRAEKPRYNRSQAAQTQWNTDPWDNLRRAALQTRRSTASQ